MNAIQEIYEIGLVKCAGDPEQAKEFTAGFLKEAFDWNTFASEGTKALGKTVATVGGGVALGLGVHGVSSLLAAGAGMNQRSRFEAALESAIASNEILRTADQARLASYAETMFKFAPKVCSDPNLLAHILSGAVHGESMDLTTIRTLADLESRYQENKQKSLFNPGTYT